MGTMVAERVVVEEAQTAQQAVLVAGQATGPQQRVGRQGHLQHLQGPSRHGRMS